MLSAIAGHVSPNGVGYKGLDKRGYPRVTVPSSMVLDPKRTDDGTVILPKEWSDDR